MPQGQPGACGHLGTGRVCDHEEARQSLDLSAPSPLHSTSEKGRHGWTVHILPYNFFYCRNSDLSGGCVFIWGGIYLSINWSNYVILHDEFIQWALNLEPSRSQMYNWCHLLLPSLLLFLEKMVLREGPGPRAGIPNPSFCLSDQGPLLHCWPWWSVILNLLPSGQSFVCPT